MDPPLFSSMVNIVRQPSLPKLALWTADILAPVWKGFYCNRMKLIGFGKASVHFPDCGTKEYLELFWIYFQMWLSVIFTIILLQLFIHTEQRQAPWQTVEDKPVFAVNLPADLRYWSSASRCTASFSNSLSGHFSWIKYHKTVKLPPWLLSIFPPSSYLLSFALPSFFSLSWGSVSHSSTRPDCVRQLFSSDGPTACLRLPLIWLVLPLWYLALLLLPRQKDRSEWLCKKKKKGSCV